MVGLKPPEVPPTAAVKFLSAGTAACIADLCTFPLDTAKVRLQPMVPAGLGVSMKMRVPIGLGGLHAARVSPRSQSFPLGWGSPQGWGSPHSQGSQHLPSPGTGLAARLLAGCTTGAVAVACAQPTDVVKVRFQANGAMPESRRRYSGTVDAYRSIAREEGVHGLWRGTLPNITRNAIVNCGELVTYDLIKDTLLRAQLMADNVPCHFVAAFGAGFCATVVASPVDVVKTRYMNASPGQYRNALSCLLALLMQDGIAGLYKGFVPSFLRLGSWNVVMFISYEQLQRAVMLAQS
ncbi:UCP3 protein, partial [Jacana jacana]|nr:UCP3 protein [Jacana jacana]